MLSLAVLTTALLFGGMTLYSFGFAAFLFSAMPPPQAGALLRRPSRGSICSSSAPRQRRPHCGGRKTPSRRGCWLRWR